MTSTGTVFDIGYQRYTDRREGRGRSRRAVFKDGVRTALGLGRGARAKILPWFFIAVMSVIGLVFAIVAGAADRLGGPGTAERANLPSHSDYYGIASIIVFVFAAVVGPELLCPDRRNGVIHLYLVRPLTGSDYITSRWAAFLVVMLVALWMPQVVLFLGLSAGDPLPVEYLRKHWLDVPRFLAAGAAMAVYATTLALLTASFTTRRAYASVFLVGLFVITTPFTVGLSSEIDGPVGQWISMFNLTNIPVHVNDVIFGDVSEVTEDAPARLLGSQMLIAWYFVWILVPGAVLWWRYRRMSP
ncbi:MAG TPA: ABC transporter permease subunit [Gemmatimonadaceae bacterium]|jgi:ABC-2 type transport system permease protein|nr:ABC transporter permease subunit [Gemmatimonadaceae bacterium]